jgi:hypothetical protein
LDKDADLHRRNSNKSQSAGGKRENEVGAGLPHLRSVK